VTPSFFIYPGWQRHEFPRLERIHRADGPYVRVSGLRAYAYDQIDQARAALADVSK